MALQFVGKDPDSPHGGSPTVWVEDETDEVVIQGWLPDLEMMSKIDKTEWVPGHPAGVPDHEGVVRIPARMIPFLREACDAAERRAGSTGLHGPVEER
ncbi:hypothetical protein BJP40_01025 [Streptomyces sp. CC53]|uniref:hypothetical protein n=1 Tax=Streptomyces sp. CC53 TaxID=1906740 RepID=UPI0008DD41D0|nr:hypothetical protein [Streptomyces sp. CC53]OII65516.1 hypothetical protein BJP40_01025 [Streptomyces sp. CC53]